MNPCGYLNFSLERPTMTVAHFENGGANRNRANFSVIQRQAHLSKLNSARAAMEPCGVKLGTLLASFE